MTQITWQSDIPIFQSQLFSTCEAGALSAAEMIAQRARELVHVETGSLQRTIDTEKANTSSEQHVYTVNAGNLEGGYSGSEIQGHPAGGPVDYADAQEFGYGKQGAHPFMVPANEEMRDAAAQAVGQMIGEITV